MDLKDKLAVAENELKIGKAEKEDLSSRLTTAGTRVSQLEEKNKCLREDVETRTKHEQVLMEQLAALQRSLESAQAEARSNASAYKPDPQVAADLESTNAQVNELQDKVNTLSLERADYKSRYASALERLDAVEEEDNERGELIDDLKCQVEKTKVELNDKITTLEKSVEEHKAIAEAEKAKTFEFKAFQVKYKSDHERLVKVEALCSARGEEIDYLKGQLSIAQVMMETKIAEAQRVLEEMRKQRDVEKAANDLLMEQARLAAAKIIALEGDLVVSRNETAAKVVELKLTQTQIQHLEEELQGLEDVLEQKEFLLKETQELLAVRDRELTSSQLRIEKLLKREVGTHDLSLPFFLFLSFFFPTFFHFFLFVSEIRKKSLTSSYYHYLLCFLCRI